MNHEGGYKPGERVVYTAAVAPDLRNSKTMLVGPYIAPVTATEVGEFVDSVAGKVRTPRDVIARLIEEAAELGLAAGMSPADILIHVTDSIHNQCLKESSETCTVFPSKMEVQYDHDAVAEEMADVRLVLKDLEYVSQVNLTVAVATKWAKFTKKDFYVADSGVIYARKPHVK